MKIIFQIFLVYLFCFQFLLKVNGTSQNCYSADYRIDTTIYPYPPILAEFPGGRAMMNKFIYSNMKFPDSAKQAGIEGKVILEFRIDTFGIITNIKILKGIGFGCDEEAIRIISTMPRWKPGQDNKKPVISLYHLPILFLIKK